MKIQKKQWHICPGAPGAEELASQLGVSPLVAQVLINRGLSSGQEARSFVSPKLIELIEPEKMPGVGPAVQRIRKALADNEKITVYGDYDVDGITSVSILWHLLTVLGGNVNYYIPHRVEEGYGLNTDAIRQIAADGTNLLITVDCGVTAVEDITVAGELGMDVIVTDHHRPHETLPTAVSIVHPNIDSTYPNPDSAGAMVAFKLAWAVVNASNGGGRASGDLRQFLLNATTLAAIGTVADVVDLRGENRILTSFGLRALQQTEMCGIRALIESADLAAGTLDSYDIGFRLAPMLNAAGRMGHARLAVELLTCDNAMRCMQIARYLKDQNRLRQQCQRKIFKEAKQMVTAMGLNHPNRKTIVLAGENWHSGVVGIVAARLVEEFLRPTIMINTGDGNGIAQGSGRSVEGFNLYEAIHACSDHLSSYGGHAMAAGLRIEPGRVTHFAEAMEQYAQENLDHDTLEAVLEIDAECSIGDLSHMVVGQLMKLEPFGQGNPHPMFATRGVRWISPPRTVGQKGDHLQIAITDGTGAVRCIGFGMGRLEKKLLESDSFSIAYEPKFNTYRGTTSIQFVLSDIQFD
ncbi:MAG: single-stranded-DNA-specific exonuclease RecJ [Sedimentisphaerales bacterium]|nr:single-stranded-DNA-specific exonuclease RecJ [Sedimentisphaerales bacterium]